MTGIKQLSDGWFDLEDRISALDNAEDSRFPTEQVLTTMSDRQTELVRSLVKLDATSLDEALQKLSIWLQVEGPMDDYSPESDFNLYGHLAATAIRDLQRLLKGATDELEAEQPPLRRA